TVRLSQSLSGSSLATPATPAVWEEAELTYDHSGPLALLAALRQLGQRGLGHPPRCSPLPSARSLCPLGCCSVETAHASKIPPSRPQLRPRPRRKALAGLSLDSCPGRSGHTPSSLSLHGAVHLHARKAW
ncbi:unnamed protein product, partial [Rangifer tarandus platyrhynchus]